jgi:hypothetical protein
MDFLGMRRNGSSSQIIDQAQDFLEQASRHDHLGQLERDVAAMADNRGSTLDQLLPRRGRQPRSRLLKLPPCPISANQRNSGRAAGFVRFTLNSERGRYPIDTEEASIVDVEGTGAMTRALWRGRRADSLGGSETRGGARSIKYRKAGNQGMRAAFEEVMEIRGEGLPGDGEVEITGADPVFATRFKIGETCASVLAGIGVAVSDIWALKTGRRQHAAIDVRRAAAALRSTRYMQRPGPDGAFADVVNPDHQAMLKITQPWPTKDGRWFLPHFGLPNLRERVLGVLGCEPHPESVGKAVAQWDALDLEAAIDEARACGAMVRSNAEWLDHPHGQALKAKPIVEIMKIADSDPEPFPEGDRPLGGIRALDLTRILAGPIAARTLAEHGADVLMVAAEHLPQIAEHVMDTSHGKRSCYLDLKASEAAISTSRPPKTRRSSRISCAAPTSFPRATAPAY